MFICLELLRLFPDNQTYLCHMLIAVLLSFSYHFCDDILIFTQLSYSFVLVTRFPHSNVPRGCHIHLTSLHGP